MKKLTNYLNKTLILSIASGLFALLAVFALSAKPAFADCSIDTTLKVGSTGQEVVCLQSSLGVTADGVFGPVTKAAVVAFQANKGLVPDGIFGPISRAAWQSGIVKTNLPPGCSSTFGYSPTTGAPCSSGVINLPAGCLPGYLFSPISGLPCTSISLPAGCTSTVGYSPTTGVKCDSNENNGENINENLNGGAGDAIFQSTSTDIQNQVKEGDSNAKILGMRVEATGSDIALKNITVSFENSPAGTSSTHLNNYISNVSVWLGGTKVGSASVSDFNRNGNVYTKNIPLSNAIIREGVSNRKYLYIAVDALSNIDSQNLNSDSWNVKVDKNSIRFMDGTGVTLTGGPLSSITTTPDFISLAESGNVRVRITRASSSSQAGNVEVSSTSSTSGINMLTFDVKAEGTDITFDSMNFNIEASGVGNVKNILEELDLYSGSTRLGDLTSFNGNGNYTINLYDDHTISEGDAETFKVVAKVNKIGTSTFAQGDSLIISAGNPLFSGILEDSNGDHISNVIGSATGAKQSFYSEGISVSNFSSSSTATTTSNGIFSKQTYNISFDVTAFGNTYYIPKSVARDESSIAGLLYTVNKSSGTVTPASEDVIVSANSSLSSNASTVNGYFEVPEGETRTFYTTITLSNTGTNMATGFYHVHLDSVHYDTDQSGTPSSYMLVPVQNYNTQDRELDLM